MDLWSNMNMGRVCVTFLGLVFFCSTFVNGACPDPYSIFPCTCEKNVESKTIISCEKIQWEEELSSAILAAKKPKIFMLQLKAASLMFFPDGLFNRTQVIVLRLVDSSVFSLGERNPAFNGLEESLVALEVSNCTFVNNWKLSELGKMKKLRHLKISDSELLELPNLNISHLPIEDLNFRGNFIKELKYKVFHDFTQLKRLTLDSNDIIEIMRSMLPIPAKNLEVLGLSYNKIQRLHANTFDQMPALKYLYLGGNPIHVLKEDIFKPIWSQLQMVLFHDCPLICDCRLAWIHKLKRAKAFFLGGTCNSPMQLKDKRLTQLLPKHLKICP